MKNLFRFTLIVSLLVVSLCTTASASPTPKVPEGWFTGGAEFMKATEAHVKLKVPIVIYFYVDWCPYCHELERDYFPAAEMREYLSSVVKVRINPELSRANRELADLFRIRGYPSFFVAAPGGSPVQLSPYLRNGRMLTPAEFAQRCRDVAAPRATSRAQDELQETKSGQKAQVVEVPKTAADAASPKFVTNAPLPTADAVLAKYAQVAGEWNFAGRIKSRAIKGRINVPGLSFGGRFEFYTTSAGKSLTIISIDSIGVMKQGFDGRAGWTVSENASKDASIPENAVLAMADFYRDVKLTELFPKTKLLGKVNEGDREIFMIEATPPGGTAEKLYFDAQSGLLVHRDFTRPSARGPIQSEIYFGDWRNVDGFRLPCSMTQTIGNLTLVLTIDEIKHNVAIDDAIFQRPAR